MSVSLQMSERFNTVLLATAKDVDPVEFKCPGWQIHAKTSNTPSK
jgi:hypothetical protein